MKTRKPLLELIPEIIVHYRKYQEYLQFNMRLYRILEGQVKTEIEDSLRKEIISPAALNRALQRIPPINLLKKTTDKLSKVYIESPIRMSDSEQDRDVMQSLSTEMHLDNVLMEANRIYNTHHTFALEPYVKDGKHAIRVLAGHQFLTYSDSPDAPNVPTVFIKLLDQEILPPEQVVDDNGKRQGNEEEVRLVDTLALYSDEEFLIIDSSGKPRYDKMAEIGITSTENPFGKIPFVIGNRSHFELIPFPNQAALDMSILIPKLLTDLNYATQFMSHSIIWTKNADLSGQEINPDAIVDLGDKTAEDGDPSIGTIDPKVDIDRVLQLIEFELSSYLSSIGIRTEVGGSLNVGDASGVSKAIDEGDTSAERKVQSEFFRGIETKLWDLLTTVHEQWVKEGRIEGGEVRMFNDDWLKGFRIQFAEMKPLKSHKQLLDEIKLARDIKLLSKKQALRMLHPDFTDEQIDKIIEELKEESFEDMEMMLDGASPAPERNENGQFNEGNQAGVDQDPTKNLESRRGN